MAETKATCPYCGVGCGVIIQHDGERVIEVRGDPDHPANFGRLCTKGSTLHFTARPETRLLFPELRQNRAEPRARVSWDQALDTAADKFASVIHTHGPDAVGFYLSGQLLTEDYYVFNKLAKGLIGSNNVDTNSRLCMSSAVAAYKQTLGADAPPCSYEDFDHADCLLIAGANPAFAHPIAFRRIEAAKAARPGMKIIVVDPRRTDTAASADLHLAILPGTDIWLFNAMLHVLLWDGYVNMPWIREHTEGFEALREAVREATPVVASGICGVSADDIVTAARWWGEAQTPLSLWCMGLNQSHHGTHNGTALIALSLAVGKIGQPGCGPFSLTGQPNAMGGREVGGLSNLLSAHRDLANPAHRAEVAALWGVESVPEKPGLSAIEMFEAVRAGQIKALWIACTNPAHSMPQQALIREALEKCEFVVLQEAYATTETAPYADLLLPALSWAEKEGTVTNSERRITHVNAAVPGPGETRADWVIARDFALKLGEKLGRADTARLFDYPTVESIFKEHADTTRGRDLDITGLSYAVLDELGPQQWPFPEGVQQGVSHLYADGKFETTTGKAQFIVPATSLTSESIDARYPLRLTTGRLRDQWHGMSRTGKTARLYAHVDEPRIELNKADIGRRGLRDGDLVRVRSRRGSIILRAHATEEVRPGHAFIAMHWGRNVLSSAGVNELTLNNIDPYSKQPELKHAAVQIEKIELPHQALLMRSAVYAEVANGLALERAAALEPWLRKFDYAAVSLAGRDFAIVVLRIAHSTPIPAEWLEQLDVLMDLQGEHCMAYADARRGVSKKALVEEGMLTGLRLTGETAAGGWLKELMIERASIDTVRRWLFAPLPKAPVSSIGRGRIVCNCLNVSENEIRSAVADGKDLAALQDALKCGTSCGSCVPELKRLVAEGNKAVVQ
ncbi:molybdopterin-dependent oxidoreductase [Uliginosibacterium sp. 31-16]|uniref:nitrate reductase n=1 Tax=Uliginosibacterium sp. 31-16 TaxID=3068315 RepID=UPI00273F6730|nr:nitrate reductase [Uliginosibacterium sp. 31-16]MDP5237926.1 molybdopterin-dependent oxidoreductase [Uliginosibacterium sp. 31-16]